MNKQSLYDYIDAHAGIFTGVSDQIWEFAEPPLQEFQSAALYCKVLREHGFTVETNLAGIHTAFSGTYGSGKPVIGILGEFDALSGLSQVGGVAVKRSAGGEHGHGCNHNLLGAGSLAAAFAVKDWLEKSGQSGTVIFFGCPGEEGGAGKTFMARAGIWSRLDAAVTWHPNNVNCVVTQSCLACLHKEYRFEGISAHAASHAPQGRSALDALELMNIGVQFLREHMSPAARVHYAITDPGGRSPNVVQSAASAVYIVRDADVGDAFKLLERVDKIAEGAALMTETKLHARYINGIANTVLNRTMMHLAYDNLCAAPLPDYTAEEEEFARQIIASYSIPRETVSKEHGDKLSPEDLDRVEELSENSTAVINRFVLPFSFVNTLHMASTDVGDVSWQTPTVQCYINCQAAGSPGHSWQNVATANTSLGHKGLLFAAKVVAGITVDLLTQPETLARARDEFARHTAQGYICPITADADPYSAFDALP